MIKTKIRTIEQVKKGMKCIISQDNGDCEDYYTCHGCPCFDPEHGSNEGVIEEGLEAIQQLEEEKKQLQKKISNQRRQLRVLHAMYEWALGRLQKANLNDRAHFQAFLRERGYDLATMALPESKYQQLERERDAAVEDVRLAVCDDLKCSTCMYKGNESHMCDDCDVHTFCNWQWRGAREIKQ